MRNRLWLVSTVIFLFACQLTQVVPTPTVPIPPATPPAVDPTVSIPSGPLIGSQRSADSLVLDSPPSFGSWEPVLVNEPEVLRLNEDQADRLSPFDLTKAQTDALNQTGFIRLENRGQDLGALVSQPLPADGAFLVTPELILLYALGTHQLVQEDLEPIIEQRLIEMTDLMITYFRAELDRLANETSNSSDATIAVQFEAARRNLAYFSVAGRQILPTLIIDSRAADLVESELALIEAGDSFISPLLGDMRSYQRLADTPLGVDRLTLWYREYPLTLSQASPEQQRIVGAQIEQLNTIWHAGDGRRWRELYQLLSFFEGDQLGEHPIWRAFSQNGMTGDAFILSAEAAGLNTFYLIPLPLSERKAIFEALTYNRVGGYSGPATDPLPRTYQGTEIGGVRGFPHPLDVAAALGSELALETLQFENETSYAGYSQQLAALQAERLRFTGRVPKTLEQGHLLAIYGLSTASESARLRPGFMSTNLWDVEQLELWESAFWLSQLPLLQSGSVANLTSINELVVLPYPHLYATLATQTRQIMTGLAEASALTEPALERLVMLERDLILMTRFAEKGWFGIGLTEEEMAQAKQIVAQVSWIPAEEGILFSSFDLQTEQVYKRAGFGQLVVRLPLEGGMRDAIGPTIRYELRTDS